MYYNKGHDQFNVKKLSTFWKTNPPPTRCNLVRAYPSNTSAVRTLWVCPSTASGTHLKKRKWEQEQNQIGMYLLTR